MYNDTLIYDIYAAIPGFPNYLISARGKILNVKTNRFLKPYWNDKRRTYLKVTLLDENGKSHKVYMHKLIVSVFGDINGHRNFYEKDIDHLNRDKLDNSIFNLEIVSHTENMQRLFKIKRKQKEVKDTWQEQD